MLCVMLCCVVCGSACCVCGVVCGLVLLVVVVCVWCVFGVSRAEFSLALERFTKETVGSYPFQV